MASAPQTVPALMFLGRSRVFGDDFAPPRQAYFAVLPAVLAFAGMLAWVLGDDAGFVLACCVATAAGLYTLWGWLLRKGPTRFSTLMAMALLLGYGGGALNTWLTLPRGSLTISATMGLPRGILAHAMGAVLMASALLYFFGEIFEKPVFGREFRFAIGQRARTLVYAGTLAMLAGYATHSMGLQGPNAAGGHLSIFGAFLAWLYSPLAAVAVAACLTAEHGRDRVLCGICSFILLMLFAFMGRRTAVYTSVEILLVLELCGYRWQGRTMRKVLLILALGAIVVAGSLTFMLLRIAGWTTRNQQQVTVGKRIEVAGKMVQSGNAYALAGASTKQNIETRTFVIGFLASVLDGSSRKTPALGSDAIGQIKLAVPRLIYPNKEHSFSEEDLVDQQFGFGFGDQANSVLTAGGTDFGLFGMMLYPLLIIAIIRTFYEFVSQWFGPVPLMFIALSILYIMLQTETTLNGYFEVIRVSIVFGLVVALFMRLPRFRLRPS